MNADIIERKHAGHGAIFLLDLKRFYVVTCCDSAQVEIVDATRRKCRTVCAAHGNTGRIYDPALTEADRAQLDQRVFGSSDFNSQSDPDGQRQQRRRQSGYTTQRWYHQRGL